VKRKLLIAGNWKMNNSIDESKALAGSLAVQNKEESRVDILVAPPFTSLFAVREAIRNSPIQLGAQNMYHEPKGAFTGEVSPTMLKEAGSSYVIIGHSERRQYFGETNSSVNRKIMATFQYGLQTIFCVGETLEQREAGQTFQVVKEQVWEGLTGVSDKEMWAVTIAYEPVWAIGTGKTATPEQAEEVHRFIRNLIKEMYGDATADSIRILYGGSVNAKNARELLGKSEIDGALVGGTSLKVDDFNEIIRQGIEVS